MSDLSSQIKEKAKHYFPYLVDVRRHLHTNPELSFKEIETSRYISTQLIKHRIEHEAGVVNTGIVALIKGKNPNKKCVLLRGDMDALPITEKNEVSYKSVNEGIMHACGHDVHSTCALGAALILNELKDSFEGSVKIIFQPGEEVLPGGASLMIKEGILENPKVDAAIALHVFTDLEAGQAGFKTGMYMASTDEIYIDVIGKGGHAAMPKEYNNPILIASEILLALNKEFPNDASIDTPTVLAFGKVVANGATNVIPEKVSIDGTFRTMNEDWRKQVHQKIKVIAEKIATEKNAKAEVKIVTGYPFLVNDEVITNSAKNVATNYLGKENVFELPLRMTAEDFAFISQQVPACFFRLGTGNKKQGIISGVHTATFNIDENAIETGSTLLAAMAVQLLAE
ncbi:MAG TPA: M20 family metallopeptidase [Bacteroidia bacterium]|jgi:amidohydrolase|nr:M20 family metallopeptidase [Bacteroidia bacterium]